MLADILIPLALILWIVVAGTAITLMDRKRDAARRAPGPVRKSSWL